jgi:hypothetical protein
MLHVSWTCVQLARSVNPDLIQLVKSYIDPYLSHGTVLGMSFSSGSHTYHRGTYVMPYQ